MRITEMHIRIDKESAGDVADPSISEKACETALQKFGRLDGLILNAGTLDPLGTPHAYSPSRNLIAQLYRSCHQNISQRLANGIQRKLLLLGVNASSDRSLAQAEQGEGRLC